MTTDYSDDTDGNKPPIPKLPDPESLTPNPYLEADAIGSNWRWGKEVASFMPNAVHVIVPGAGHTPDDDCTRSIRHAPFRSGTTKNLDTACPTCGGVCVPAPCMPLTATKPNNAPRNFLFIAKG